MLKVKVIKILDTDGRHIATLDAFLDSISVYRMVGVRSDGPSEIDLSIIGDAQDMSTRELREIAREACEEMFPHTEVRFGRATKHDFESYFGCKF